MNTDAQVMPQAVEYFRYYFLGVLATGALQHVHEHS